MLSEMDREKIDFVALKRKAPGKFSEQIISALPAALKFDGISVEVVKLELGDDPFNEKLEIDVRVNPPEEEAQYGPELFFTFTSELSPAENFQEFRDFVEQHHQKALSSPQVEQEFAASHSGD